MQQALQITFRNLDHSDAAESYIREQTEKLTTFEPHLIGCRVTLEQPHRHRHAPAPRVRIELLVRGEDIVVDYTPPDEAHEEGFRAAIDQAFARAKRRLVSHAGRVRDEHVRAEREVSASRR